MQASATRPERHRRNNCRNFPIALFIDVKSGPFIGSWRYDAVARNLRNRSIQFFNRFLRAWIEIFTKLNVCDCICFGFSKKSINLWKDGEIEKDDFQFIFVPFHYFPDSLEMYTISYYFSISNKKIDNQ